MTSERFSELKTSAMVLAIEGGVGSGTTQNVWNIDVYLGQSGPPGKNAIARPAVAF